MVLIILSSIVVVAVAIERYAVFRRASAGGDAALRGVIGALRDGDAAGALGRCGGIPGAAAAVLNKGLAVYRPGRMRVMKEAMEGAAAAEIAVLRRRLSYLATIATVAPLLGLLGTVLGMIKTFNVLAVSAGQPSAVTGGVGEALVATAAGLVVAVMAMLMFSIYSEWLERIIADMENAANCLLEALEGGEGDQTVGL